MKEEHGRLHSMWSQIVGHDQATNTFTFYSLLWEKAIWNLPSKPLYFQLLSLLLPLHTFFDIVSVSSLNLIKWEADLFF